MYMAGTIAKGEAGVGTAAKTTEDLMLELNIKLEQEALLVDRNLDPPNFLQIIN